MSGKSGSSLGTLLFSVPLAAIPLMAIFGIPQFAPLVASPERAGGYERSRDDGEPDGRSASRRRGRSRVLSEELDEDFDRNRPASAFADERTGVELGFADRSAAQDDEHHASQAPFRGDVYGHSQVDSDAPPFASPTDRSQPLLRGARDDAPTASDASLPAASGRELTWQTAARRFQELGITSYHLEPGAEATSFLFVCSFFPAANSNVEMRFESEAAEPLDAVNDVLAQIERWQQQQQAGGAAGVNAPYAR